MKQRLLLFITALMLCIGAKATTIQVIDGLKYIIYTDQNYAVLTGNNYTQREIVIPASITWEGKKYPVTELGAKCFYKCTGLTSVTIPSSVTSLGDYCFVLYNVIGGVIVHTFWKFYRRIKENHFISTIYI